MSPTKQRDKVGKLAKADPRAALDLARSIDDPWFRCQALAFAARYAIDSEVVRITAEAFDAAARAEDPFKTVGASVLPLRVLVERGFTGDLFKTQCAELTARTNEIEPPSSRCEALFRLFEAAFPAGREAWLAMFEGLRMACDPADHWRCERNMRDAIVMVADADRELAKRVLTGLPDGKLKRRVANNDNGQWGHSTFSAGEQRNNEQRTTGTFYFFGGRRERAGNRCSKKTSWLSRTLSRRCKLSDSENRGRSNRRQQTTFVTRTAETPALPTPIRVHLRSSVVPNPPPLFTFAPFHFFSRPP